MIRSVRVTKHATSQLPLRVRMTFNQAAIDLRRLNSDKHPERVANPRREE
jgi:hypothetical protein